jgi:anaerobic magnesium-protoporphyrin IX monomethyl ester cyclase
MICANEAAENLGNRPLRALPQTQFPDVGQVLATGPARARPAGAVDVLLVNPPAPDGAIWIRCQHRVGRRSRENMIWPQVSLAQLAALLHPDYSVEIVDAIPGRMSWETFERLLAQKQPRYYVTHVTAPTLTNDMRGTFLARAQGARTIAFGTHVTPLPRATMEAFPSLDYALRGEPELTLRELLDTLDRGGGQEPEGGRQSDRQLAARLERLFTAADPGWRPAWEVDPQQPLAAIKGLVWRDRGVIRINPDRPLIRDLDDLPLPLHGLLPWRQYRAPNIRGPYTFIVPSRGCPGGCTFCIKHVSYGSSVRLRSPQNVLAELKLLWDLGLRNVHMYADLFTANREQVMGICEGMMREGLRFRWTCNSRVDYVDPEMLRAMKRAGCWMISWGIESASEEILRHVHKGIQPDKVARALRWSKEAGIMNWGFFILGLPGESEESIQATIALAKKLPLDLALFHLAAPYPGTPFFFEVVENGWFRPGTRWEEVDMDESTVLDYPGLPAERIEYWARRAFREWALRPGPLWTYLKSMRDWYSFQSAVNVGLQALGWMR